MGISAGADVVEDGLVFCVDAAGERSYPGTGTVWTDLAGENNGTLTNGPTFSSDNVGSIVFDGTNDYVDTGNWSNSLDFITVSAWVKPVDSARGDYVAKWSNGNYQYVLLQGIPSGKFQFYVSRNGSSAEGSGGGTTTIVADNWYHIVGTYDGLRSRIFVNGVEENSTAYSGTLYGSSSLSNKIGKSDDELSTGRISNVQIYNRALTADEVLQNYLAIRGRFQ